MRVGRAFARLFNLSGSNKRHRPGRWPGSYPPTNGRAEEDDPFKTGIHATKWPLHAQWARPAGLTNRKAPANQRRLSLNRVSLARPNEEEHEGKQCEGLNEGEPEDEEQLNSGTGAGVAGEGF